MIIKFDFFIGILKCILVNFLSLFIEGIKEWWYTITHWNEPEPLTDHFAQIENEALRQESIQMKQHAYTYDDGYGNIGIPRRSSSASSWSRSVSKDVEVRQKNDGTWVLTPIERPPIKPPEVEGFLSKEDMEI